MRGRVDFALIDQALFVVMQKHDWCFDCDHVLITLGIDFVEHGGESCGFPRPRRTRDEHQSARLIAELLNNRRQSESFEPLDFPRNRPEHGRNSAALMEQVSSEGRTAL